MFNSPKELFSFWRHFNFCSDSFSHVEKQVVKKAKGNFKIYGIINWETNEYNIHTAHYSLLTYRISLSDCMLFLRSWAMPVS